MSRPTQAKYCPRCHAMNHVETERCTYCGHQFRTGLSSVTPSEEALKKTQMFTLPPLTRRPDAEDAPPRATGRRARLVSLLATIRASPLLPAIALLAAVIVALICWTVLTSR